MGHKGLTCLGGQAQEEDGAFAGLAVRADRAAVALSDLAADGQAHAAALVDAPRLQALERLEHLVEVLLAEADAVVSYADLDAPVGPALAPDRDLRRHAV